MLDPFRVPPGMRSHDCLQSERTSDVIWIVATAMVLLAIGVGFLAVAERPIKHTAANPSAVTAPADETTGRAMGGPVPGQVLDPIVPR